MNTYRITAEVTVELQAFGESDALDAVSDALIESVPGGKVDYKAISSEVVNK